MTKAKESPSITIASILKEALADRKDRNRSYSVRAFARDAKVSPAFLNMVLKGNRHLSLDRASRIAELLKLPPKKKIKFMRAAALSALVGKEDNAADLAELLFNIPLTQNYVPLEIDQFQFFCSWHHVAILDLTTCANFRSDLVWIAKRLGLDLNLVKDSITRLLRLGLLEYKSGQLRKTKEFLNIPTKDPQGAIHNFHLQMIKKSKEALEEQTAESFAKRHISGITFAINSEKIEEAKAKIARFKREMSELLSDGDCTEVYQMNVHFFPLTKVGAHE